MRLVSKAKRSTVLRKIITYLVVAFLGLYIFSVPSFGESSSITRYFIYISMILLGFSSFLGCILYDNFRIKLPHLLIPMFAVFAFVGTLFFSHQFRSWVTLILLTISFFVFYFSFKFLKNKYLVISIIAIAFFLFSLYFIFHYRKEIADFRSYTNSDFRLGDYFDNPNGIGVYSAIGVSASLYMILFWKNNFRFIFILPVLTLLLMGLTTGSRSFLLVVLIVLLMFLFFKFKRHKLIYLIVVASVLGLSVLLLSLPFMNTIRDRLLQALQTFFGGGNKVDTSTLERTIWMDYGVYLGSKNLIIGYGCNGFALFSGVGTYTHSNFSEIICDFGLVGFSLFYLPLIILTIKSIKNERIDKSFVFAFVAYFLFTSFSSVFYYKKVYYLILAFLFYLVYVDGVCIKKEKIVPSSLLKRVVFTCDTMSSGGAEKVIASLANEMVSKGIEVIIIGVADLDNSKPFYSLDDRISYLTLSNGSRKLPMTIARVFRLRKIIKHINPDVVLSFLPNSNVYTWVSLVLTKIPYIVSERNNPYVDPKSAFRRLIKRFAFHYSSGAVFQTNDAMNYYSDYIREKSVIIKNPVVIDIGSETRRQQKDKIVLSVGRLTEQKNPICLLEAFRIFNIEQNYRYTLRIYGDGPLRQMLNDYCLSNNMSEYVEFKGNDSFWHRKELNDALFVLSSNYEGMPNSLAEAMALGIPCISTNCPIGGPKELIQDGYNGALVPVNNPQMLAEKMSEIIKESPAKYFENTRDFVANSSLKKITSQWIDYIISLERIVYE